MIPYSKISLDSLNSRLASSRETIILYASRTQQRDKNIEYTKRRLRDFKHSMRISNLFLKGIPDCEMRENG